MKKLTLALALLAVFLLSGWLMWHNTEHTEEFMHPTTKYALWSFVIGALVTISLPIGAIVGIAAKPSQRVTSSLTAFGAGALLAALSVELIAPTVEEIIGHLPSPTHMDQDHRTKIIITLS
jgi:peptidoglycan/LPS O-acetylase OafA/YrhL